MAFVTDKQKKLQIFIVIFIIIIVITVIVLYFGFLRRPSQPVTPSLLPGMQTNSPISGISQATIDWEFLDSPVFNDLRFFGENPVTPGDRGRQNPFVTF